jgi:hypothetical protein
MSKNEQCLTGEQLLNMCTNTDIGKRLDAFLHNRKDDLGAQSKIPIHKSILVLRGSIRSSLHVVGDKDTVLPEIKRTGKAAPAMYVPELGELLTTLPFSTDPDEQRISCDYIEAHIAVGHIMVCSLRFMVMLALWVCLEEQRATTEVNQIRNRVDKIFREGAVPWFPDNRSGSEDSVDNLFSDFTQRSFYRRTQCFIHSYWNKITNNPEPITGEAILNYLLDNVEWEQNRTFQNHTFLEDWDESYSFLEILYSLIGRIDKETPPGFWKSSVSRQWEKWRAEGRLFGDLRVPAKPTENAVKRALIVLTKATIAHGETKTREHGEKKTRLHLCHLEDIMSDDQGQRSIIIQGAGDISMNSWNVAYLASNDRFIIVDQEPVERREYSCLISWKRDLTPQAKSDLQALLQDEKHSPIYCAGLPDSPSLSIGRVLFNRFGRDESRRVRLVCRNDNLPIRDYIEYALYGQRLAWQGKVVDPREIIEQCSDLRHILSLPGLNFPWKEKDAIDNIAKAWAIIEDQEAGARWLLPHLDKEAMETAFVKRPRHLFGMLCHDDIWLGEHAFLSNLALVKAACEHPVEIELADLGAPIDWITVCLISAGYTLKSRREMVSERGEFTWDLFDPTDPKLIWFPRLNRYPCTMIGIGSLRLDEDQSSVIKSETRDFEGDLFLLAWGHQVAHAQSYTIFDCAQLLCDLGATTVLMIDEGRDVFQYHFPTFKLFKDYNDDPQPAPQVTPVPPSREQIRGTLAFWIQK